MLVLVLGGVVGVAWGSSGVCWGWLVDELSLGCSLTTLLLPFWLGMEGSREFRPLGPSLLLLLVLLGVVGTGEIIPPGPHLNMFPLMTLSLLLLFKFNSELPLGWFKTTLLLPSWLGVESPWKFRPLGLSPLLWLLQEVVSPGEIRPPGSPLPLVTLSYLLHFISFGVNG